MAQTPLPTAKEIRDVFEGLLGRTVEVETDYEIIKPEENWGAAVSIFIDALNKIRAVCVADFDLCAYAGAAIQLIPPDAAKSVIADGNIPDTYIENVYEILNVFSSLFNKEGAPHLRIDLMYTPGEALPPDLADLVTSYAERRDSILKIDGYGQGRFGVIVQD